MALLEMNGAGFVRRGRTLLAPVTVAVDAGERVERGLESATAAAVAARLAAGIAKCTTGTVFVGDYDPKIQPVHVKRLAGFVPYDPPTTRMGARAYFAYRAALWGIDQTQAIARGMQLLSASDGLDRAHQLALAGALLHDPQLLVLERPGQGLRAAAEAVLDGRALFVTYGPSERVMTVDALHGTVERA